MKNVLWYKLNNKLHNKVISSATIEIIDAVSIWITTHEESIINRIKLIRIFTHIITPPPKNKQNN